MSLTTSNDRTYILEGLVRRIFGASIRTGGKRSRNLSPRHRLSVAALLFALDWTLVTTGAFTKLHGVAGYLIIGAGAGSAVALVTGIVSMVRR